MSRDFIYNRLNLYSFLFLLSIIGWGTPLFAIPFHGGISVGYATRDKNEFDRGLANYRSSLFFLEERVSSATPGSPYHPVELWGRVGDVIGRNHFFGLAVGSPMFSDRQNVEIRGDDRYYRAEHKFTMYYTMFTYHYLFFDMRVGRLRHAIFELGGGVGFFPEAAWNINGYYIYEGELSQFKSYQYADYGTIARLESALTIPIANRLFLRQSIRYSYMYIDKFSGTINGTVGTYYLLADGSMSALTESAGTDIEYMTYYENKYNTNLNLLQGARRIKFTASTLEYNISLGIRL